MVKFQKHSLRISQYLLFFAMTFAGATNFSQTAATRSPPRIQVTTDPSRVRNGESILFKLRIETHFDDVVEEINFPKNEHWRIVNVYKDPSTLSQTLRGKRILRKVIDYSYTLSPLKKGLIPVPILTIIVNGKPYKSYASLVQVDKIRAQNMDLPPIAKAPQQQRTFKPFNRIFPQNPNDKRDDGLEDQLIDVPDLDTHFVRAIAGKTTVYEGELLPVSYRVFQRKRARLDNATIAKFPDFKGFLKEELFIARQYIPKPTSIRGENFLEFELIRYALFPLKTGLLTIDPLRFRSTYYPSLEQLQEDLLFGTSQFSPQGIPMEKSSQSLKINVRPLPPAPAQSNFTGSVGVFSLEMTAPSTAITVGSPFTMTVTITGEGNVKSIEEPVLNLPEGVELKQTQNKYEFDVNASGFKVFEYILVAKNQGLKKISELKWTFFNPYSEKYQTLTSDKVEFTVLPATSNLTENPSDPKNPVLNPDWQPINTHLGIPVGLKDFYLNHGLWKPIRVLGWKFIFFAYLCLAGLMFYLSRRKKRRAFLAQAPWIKTEYKLQKSLKQNNVPESIRLMDLWIRQKLLKSLEEQNWDRLNVESERAIFYQALEKKLQPAEHFLIRNLELQFNQMDQVRFANTQSPISQSELEKLFASIREEISKISP
jgi:hypothetical protein